MPFPRRAIWRPIGAALALTIVDGRAAETGRYVDPHPSAVGNPWFAGPPKIPDVANVQTGRQLFVDNHLIEQTTLRREYFQAQYHEASPVLRPDKPWEGTVVMPISDGAWYDPADGLFKLWYRTGSPPKQDTCYAFSRDGIRWEKPALDVVPGTNIVMRNRRAAGTVWLDLEEKDPERRFKFFHSHSAPHPLGYEKGIWGLSLHYSADGIHWSDPIRRTGWVGDRSTVFYNPFRAAWVYSIRNPDWKGPRKRFYWEAKKLESETTWDLHRTPPLPWLHADEGDAPFPGTSVPAELYNFDAVAYESIMLGFFTILRGDVDNKTPVEPDRPKPNNVCLGFSRDGFHWQRPDRRPFLDYANTKGAWNWGNVQSVGGGCLIVGDQLYFYASGRSGAPDGRDNGVSVGLATLRRDGFAAMVADGGGGTLTTRRLRVSGPHLFINAAAGDGEVKVEVLGEDGAPLPGYGLADAVPWRGDSTRQNITWNGRKDLDSLRGQAVRLRFHLRSAQLFAFWLSPDAAGHSGGYVAAGGPGFSSGRDISHSARPSTLRP